MAIDPPYRLDPFQNIVNIHWETPSSGTGAPAIPGATVPVSITLSWFQYINATITAHVPADGHYGPYLSNKPGTLSGSPGEVDHYGVAKTLDASPGLTCSYSGLVDGTLTMGPFSMELGNLEYTTDGPPVEVFRAARIADIEIGSGGGNPQEFWCKFNVLLEKQD